MNRNAQIAGLCTLLAALSPGAPAASFDCSKAITQVEKLVCADSELSKLDDKLAAAYTQALESVTDREEVKRQQRGWFSTRNLCTNVSCLNNSYEMRLAQLSDPNSTEQKEKIVAILRDIKLEQQQFGRPTDPLCSQFLEDFRKQKNIQHLQPIVQTDDYDDPRLRAYRARCPNLKLNKHMGYSPNVYYEGLGEESEETQEAAAAYISYGTKNFRLYKLDINNNPNDGEEYIFYDEANRFVKPEMSAGKIISPDAGSYLVADFAKCETRGGTATASTTLSKDRVGNFHGPIKHREKYYVYTLEVTKNNQANLYLGRFQSSLHGKVGLGQACVYRVLPSVSDGRLRGNVKK